VNWEVIKWTTQSFKEENWIKFRQDSRVVQCQILVTTANLWCRNNRSGFEKLYKSKPSI
jgi:hypothetical protein